MQKLPSDNIALAHFSDLIFSYRSVFSNVKSRFYLRNEIAACNGYADFKREISDACKNIRENTNDFLFRTYEEFTSGSSGEPKKCIRPSISLHLEFMRLRDLLDGCRKWIQTPSALEILYYSRYGSTSFQYTDRILPSIEIYKYTYDHAQDLYEHMSSSDDYILSGSPSSIIELAEMGFTEHSPQLIMLSGEHTPSDIWTEISYWSSNLLNVLVAREFGLFGFECFHRDKFHFFSNCLAVTNDSQKKLRVSDPANYLESGSPVTTNDFVDRLFLDECICGFKGTSAHQFQGRNYRKPIQHYRMAP